MAAGAEGGMEEEPSITASYRRGSSSDPVWIGPQRLTAPGPDARTRPGLGTGVHMHVHVHSEKVP